MNRRSVSIVLVLLLAGPVLRSQEVEPKPDAAPQGSETIALLNAKAARITTQYVALENLMRRMAEIEAVTNPQRAALLKRAAQHSAERRTKKKLDDATEFLVPPGKLKQAVDEQEEALADMKSLLELLLSEDRADRLKAEENRIRAYIKEVERLIRLQKSAEGRARGGADAQRIADEQDRIANRTGNLADEIKENEEGGGQDQSGDPSEAKPSESDPSKGEQSGSKSEGEGSSEGEKSEGDKPEDGDKPKDGDKPEGEKGEGDKPGEKPEGEKSEGDKPKGESSEGEKSEGEKSEGDPKESGKPGEKSESQPGKPSKSEGQSGESQSGGKPSDQQQQSQDENANPARKRLEEAQERMREAQKQLEEAKRDKAVEEQEKARQKLEEAKAQLEEILRQLREEEIGRTLAMLEGRFRRMLEKQLVVYESTKRLDKVDPEQRGRQVDIQANKLGFEETKLAVEADKALLLLLEEGSSIAFPETVQLMRDDMAQVADRLSATKLGVITQGIEEEIISALEEMIAALQQAQKDLEEQQQQQQQQQQQGEPPQKPLVDKIAELKMIRALQMRVNTRTKRYARLLEDDEDIVGQTDDEELRVSLEKLGERQERIQEVTHDIVLGKNR